MIDAHLDTREWEIAVGLLAKVSKKELIEVVEQSARLVMRDIVRLTPPFGNAPIKEAFTYKREIGKAAVATDIQKIFRTFNPVGLGRLGGRVKQLVEKGDFDTAKMLLNKAGFKCHRIFNRFDKECERIHRNAQNSGRGRVRWSESRGKIFILNNAGKRKSSDLSRYIKRVQKHVGTAMSGWATGVQLLGVKRIPKWAKARRPQTQGMAAIKRGTGSDWAFVVSNKVGYAKELGVRPVQRAIKNQTRNLKKRMEKALKYAARKSGFGKQMALGGIR